MDMRREFRRSVHQWLAEQLGKHMLWSIEDDLIKQVGVDSEAIYSIEFKVTGTTYGDMTFFPRSIVANGQRTEWARPADEYTK